MKKIHLGENLGGNLKATAEEMPAPETATIFPTLHISSEAADELASMPKSGKAVIEFKVKHISIHSGHGDRKARTSLELDIISIEPMGKKGVSEKPIDENQESASAMDELLGQV